MQIVDTRPPQAKQENRIFRAIGCTAVYLTSAGALCSMQGLPDAARRMGGWHGAAVGTLFSAEASKDSKYRPAFSLSAAWRCGVVFVGVRARRRLSFREPAICRQVNCSRLTSMKSCPFTRRRRNRPAAYRRPQFCLDCCLRSCWRCRTVQPGRLYWPHFAVRWRISVFCRSAAG